MLSSASSDTANWPSYDSAVTLSRTPATSGASGTASKSRAPAKYRLEVGPGTLVTYRLIWLDAARFAHATPNQARLAGSATIPATP
jgi:hypothetical protein